jgi:hypothetical protein
MHPHASRAAYWCIRVSFAGVLLAVYLGTLERGLWEDGYFVKRFAYNLWHHGTLAWNPSDGPVYGMTSQVLQLLGVLLYGLAPDHLVLGLKAALTLLLFAALLVIEPIARDHVDEPAHAGSASRGLCVALVGLSMPILLELILSGLETVLALTVVALSVAGAIGFARGERGRWSMTLLIVLVYLTRPDAILIPVIAVAGLTWPAWRRLGWLGALVGASLALLLLGFKAYYGTALPLPFYVKTQALGLQPNLDPAQFAAEKVKNAIQAAFLAAPFVYIALHRRTRLILTLLASGMTFAGYHYFATTETMGHLSRFYVPAIAPLLIAAVLAYPSFRERQRTVVGLLAVAAYLLLFVWLWTIDQRYRVAIMLPVRYFVPFLLACAALLIAPPLRPAVHAALVGAILCAGAIWNYPARAAQFRPQDDETILLRQIAPRRTFRGLRELRERVPVKTLYHTDMGAPGLLFPEARVVDLDGLLNEDITLRHTPFEQLCSTDRPEAIFIPNEGYPRLRAEVLNSRCIRAYKPANKRRAWALFLRKDVREQSWR